MDRCVALHITIVITPACCRCVTHIPLRCGTVFVRLEMVVVQVMFTLRCVVVVTVPVDLITLRLMLFVVALIHLIDFIVTVPHRYILFSDAIALRCAALIPVHVTLRTHVTLFDRLRTLPLVLRVVHICCTLVTSILRYARCVAVAFTVLGYVNAVFVADSCSFARIVCAFTFAFAFYRLHVVRCTMLLLHTTPLRTLHHVGAGVVPDFGILQSFTGRTFAFGRYHVGPLPNVTFTLLPFPFALHFTPPADYTWMRSAGYTGWLPSHRYHTHRCYVGFVGRCWSFWLTFTLRYDCVRCRMEDTRCYAAVSFLPPWCVCADCCADTRLLPLHHLHYTFTHTIDCHVTVGVLRCVTRLPILGTLPMLHVTVAVRAFCSFTLLRRYVALRSPCIAIYTPFTAFVR